MRRQARALVAVCAFVLLLPGVAGAQPETLTLPQVLARVRERAPQVVGARLAVDEARGGLAGASLKRPANPEVEAGIANRQGPDRRFTDFEIGVSQAFAPPSRREARVAGAEAAIARSTADVDEAVRRALHAAATTSYRLVYIREQIRLLERSEELAKAVFTAADRRFKAGDIPVLDVNLARMSLARAAAEREGAEASRAAARGELRQLLGADTDVDVSGALTVVESPSLASALQAASGRPDLTVLASAVRQAEADVRLGQSYGKTEYGVGLLYSRDAGDNRILGGVRLTFPAFSSGQELQAVGAARATRLRAELEAARARIRAEVESAYEVYQRRLAAMQRLESDAIPGLDENEALTTRSFEVGQIGLPELLLIRRVLLETRVQHVNALLEAALARTDLEASAGLLR